MKAIQYTEYGSEQVLHITEVSSPVAQNDQILIKVKAFGINPLDWKLRRGDMRQFIPLQFPVTPGFEAAGIVVALGDNVKQFKIGDRIYGRSTKSYAEYSLIELENAQIIPSFLDFTEAASLPSNSTTAFSAIKTLGNIEKNQKVLIHAGAGGVGINAIQIAKYYGAHVTATVSEKNIELVKSLGANAVIDYQKTALNEITERFDLIIDSIGGQTQIESWDLLNSDGHLISLVSDLQSEFNPAEANKKFTFMRGVVQNEFSFINELISQKKIKPVIDQIFNFDDITQAHLKSQSGHLSGKIVVKI